MPFAKSGLLPGLLIGLAFFSTGAVLADEFSTLAQRLDRTASGLVEAVAVIPAGPDVTSRKFPEALDEFAGQAHELATNPGTSRRQAERLRRLSLAAARVTGTIGSSGVSAEVTRQWQQARALLEDLHAIDPDASSSRGGVEAADVPARPGATAGPEEAATELKRTADELLETVKFTRDLSVTERENLTFKFRHLAENAQSVADLAGTERLPSERLDRALTRVDHYSDLAEEEIARLTDVSPFRNPHTAFLLALDGMHATVRAAVDQAAARAASKPKPRPKRKPSPKPKPAPKAKAASPSATRGQ